MWDGASLGLTLGLLNSSWLAKSWIEFSWILWGMELERLNFSLLITWQWLSYPWLLVLYLVFPISEGMPSTFFLMFIVPWFSTSFLICRLCIFSKADVAPLSSHGAELMTILKLVFHAAFHGLLQAICWSPQRTECKACPCLLHKGFLLFTVSSATNDYWYVKSTVWI